MFAAIGEFVNLFLEMTGAIVNMIFKSIKDIHRLHGSNYRKQFLHLGYDSLTIVIITAFFVGMVFAIQVAKEFLRFGAGNMVGGVLGLAIWRELGPAITAVVVAGRVGSAIAAELGTMKVTEQIDAIESFGIDHFYFLVMPRIWALTTVMPFLVAIADLVGVAGGYLVSVNMVGINSVAFFDSFEGMLTFRDLWGGMLKSVFFGLTTSAISCYYGLKTSSGARGVGEATTNSVVISLIVIFILNYLLSMIIF